MSKCPKCGSRVIRGPFYRNRGYHDELEYICTRCGYSQPTECNDRIERREKQQRERT